MIRIVLSNNKSRILAPTQTLFEIRENPKLKVRNKGAFYSPAFRNRTWDGFTRYVTESGLFSTGLIDYVTEALDSMKLSYRLEDSLEHLEVIPQKEINNITLRDYQGAGVEAVINHKFKGVTFQRGILHEATNAGKSIIAMGLYASFDCPSILLIDNILIHNQLYRDLLAQFPDEVGVVDSKRFIWKRFNVCMVQSLANKLDKLPKVKKALASIKMILVDECDLVIGKKPTKKILSFCYEAPVRIGLSGTIFKKRDKLQNYNVQAFFGPIIHKTTNKQLVEAGVSTPPDIRIVMGNVSVYNSGDFGQEYIDGVIKCRRRNKRAWRIAEKSIQLDRAPILILFKLHKHIKYLKKTLPDSLKHLRIEYATHKTKNREQLLNSFSKGKIDIFCCSMIIRRGMNLPTIYTLINIAGGSSENNVLQILGRALRTYKGKDKVYIYDFYDLGAYLERHSKHRVGAYKDEGLGLKKGYEKLLKKYKSKKNGGR